ncbi:MAG: hypothetical protein ACJ72V_01035 [Nitrososphaeraceae archaeon]
MEVEREKDRMKMAAAADLPIMNILTVTLKKMICISFLEQRWIITINFNTSQQLQINIKQRISRSLIPSHVAAHE